MRRDDPDAIALAEPVTLPAEPARVIAALEPLLTDERRERIEAVVAARTRAVIPILEHVDDPHNVAAVLRSAEAFGLQEVQLIERQEPFVAARKVTQGTDRWLDIERHDGARSCIDGLRARGYRVFAATLDGALGLDEVARHERVAVAFANEHDGASAQLIELADGCFTVPMRGFAQSLNVSVAAAVTFFAATAGRSSDLAPDERQTLRARYMMLSVPRAHEIVSQACGQVR